MLVPADHQPAFPRERTILENVMGDDVTPVDVLFVGGGPAGLAGAIRLAQLVEADENLDVEIGVLEKAGGLGEHNLSGAVVNPIALRELFPDTAIEELPLYDPVGDEQVFWLSESGKRRVPTPAEMHNRGNHVASICEIVRWLGERAEGMGINVFTGFPAEALHVRDGAVVGVRTTATGLDREGNPGGADYMPPNDLSARITVIADGTRSNLAQAFFDWQGLRGANPQIYALGVKELWEVRRPLESVVHTLGWPFPRDVFGGSWFYPMGKNLVSLGLVAGLDYPDRTFDLHRETQRLKSHPLFREVLDGGELLEWGAKTIPEGGYHAVPERLHGDGVLVTGDAAGLVNVAALKGIHYAMHSGIYAAEACYEALRSDDVSASGLESYDRKLRASYVFRDLKRTRNMRLAFKSGFYLGGAKAFVMSATGGRFPGGRIHSEPDAAEPRRAGGARDWKPDGTTTFSKVDAVFRSGNSTRDDVPSHLLVGEKVSPELAEFYSHLCPAGVYEWDGESLVVNAPNCVDCKATDVVGPRWTPREGGSGPAYKRM